MKVFVYGSLKQGFGNHDVMSQIGAVFISTAITEHTRFDLVTLGHFPGLVTGKYQVEGEVYEVDADALRTLDHFEGSPTFYKRKEIPVLLIKEKALKETFAYVYILNRKVTNKIVETFSDSLKTIKKWVE